MLKGQMYRSHGLRSNRVFQYIVVQDGKAHCFVPCLCHFFGVYLQQPLLAFYYVRIKFG